MKTSTGSNPENKQYNRFAGIFPCKYNVQNNYYKSYIFKEMQNSADDENRVLLIPIEKQSDCQHDYINASLINVSCLKYII